MLFRPGRQVISRDGPELYLVSEKKVFWVQSLQTERWYVRREAESLLGSYNCS